MNKYAKAALAVVVTVVSAIIAYASAGTITNVDWVLVAISGVGAASVFAAPNVPGAPYTKAVLAVLSAVLALLVTVIVGGITTTEWLQLAVAGLGAIGIYNIKNADPTPVVVSPGPPVAPPAPPVATV